MKQSSFKAGIFFILGIFLFSECAKKDGSLWQIDDKMTDCGSVAGQCGSCPVGLTLSCLGSKSLADKDNEIWDANIYAFDAYGSLVHHSYISFAKGYDSKVDINCTLLESVDYNIYAIANIGFKMEEMTLEDLESWALFLGKPEGNIRGIPMSGRTSMKFSADNHACRIEMTRMMAKVSLSLDKSQLREDVSMHVREARICNCPKKAYAFRPNSIEGKEDCFVKGPSCDMISGSTLYLLESLQHGSSARWDTVNDGSANGDGIDHSLCPYIEVEFDYISDKYETDGYTGLIYRIHIKDGEGHGARRNAHYNICVQPVGDGLGGNRGNGGNGGSGENGGDAGNGGNEGNGGSNWRIDKSALIERRN